jgi:hypothetical protein
VATWQLIEHASRTVLRLIEAQLAVTMPGSQVDVKLATPQSFGELKNVTRSTISLFLYRVSENAEMRNGLQRRLPDGRVQRQPMALELSYLVTTWGARGSQVAANDGAAALEEHRLLGMVMQGFYDHAELSRGELYEDPGLAPVWNERDSLQIVFESLGVEDLSRIWDSGELSYQLSAAYRVRVLSLESREAIASRPVVDADLQIARAP